jgi:RNA polymerase sigma-70 factor (ECF subfamily)
MVADFLGRTSAGLERVYTAYKRQLYMAARTILHDDDDAIDCVHDALLRVWLRSESYRAERGSLRAYLVVCVRNDALTRKRNAARHAHLEAEAARAERSAYDLEVSDPIERDRLRAALEALPREQRSALDLVYFGRLTHSEAAARLGAPLGTVKSRIALALRKLQSVLSVKQSGMP